MAFAALSFTSCDDDDDTFLGIDFDDDGTLFISSNTSGMVGVLNLEAGGDPMIETFTAAGTDGEGIYYDSDDGDVYQVDRSNDVLVEYDDVRDDLDDPDGVDVDQRSTSNFNNGRGLGFLSRNFIVAQRGDNDDDFKLVQYNTLNDDAIEYVKTFDVDFPLWGIQFIERDLYAVVDGTDSVAIFDTFLGKTNDTTLMADRFFKVDGITRTHGLYYNAADDVMILTDIGDADSDTDGALIVIDDFSNFSTTDTITSADYRRIAGSATNLGNPVDVSYDPDEDRIYVAERANGGGTLLVFDRTNEGDVAPTRTLPFPGISALWLHRD